MRGKDGGRRRQAEERERGVQDKRRKTARPKAKVQDPKREARPGDGFSSRRKREETRGDSTEKKTEPFRAAECRASVETEEQLRAVLREDRVQLVYLEEAGFPEKRLAELLREIALSGKKAGLRLPRIERGERSSGSLHRASLVFSPERLEGLLAEGLPDAFLIRSIEDIAVLTESCKTAVRPPELVFDYTVYAYNTAAAELLRELGAERLCCPIELSFRELKALRQDGLPLGLPYELLVYGHLPMMVSANCIRKSSLGCNHGNEIVALKDRMGKSMPVRCYCKYCYNQIFNAEALCLYDLPGELAQLAPESIRYDFSVERGEEVRRILEGYLPYPLTRGHFHRGVE